MRPGTDGSFPGPALRIFSAPKSSLETQQSLGCRESGWELIPAGGWSFCGSSQLPAEPPVLPEPGSVSRWMAGQGRSSALRGEGLSAQVWLFRFILGTLRLRRGVRGCS